MPGLYALRPHPSASIAPRKPAKKQQQDGLHYCNAGRPPPTTLPQPPRAAGQPIRPRHKRASDLLAEPVRAIYGAKLREAADIPPLYASCSSSSSSSGSDHGPSSACLAALVHEFMEGEPAEEGAARGRCRCSCASSCCSGDEQDCRKERGGDDGSSGEEFLAVLEGVMSSCTDEREGRLVADLMKAVEAVGEKPKPANYCSSITSFLQRSAMTELRRMGYHAAICKSRWDHTAGLPAGNHEYMDVVIAAPDDRFIIDLDFKPQFQIARPTTIYMSCLSLLPPIFVGRPEKLQQVVRIMSEAAKCSLRRRGLHVPPWRKLSYMQAKWFSSYKRTTNEEPHLITLPADHHRLRPSIAFKGSQLRLCPAITNRVQEFPCNGVFSKAMLNATHDAARPEKRRGRLVSGIAGAFKTCRLESLHAQEEGEEKET